MYRIIRGTTSRDNVYELEFVIELTDESYVQADSDILISDPKNTKKKYLMDEISKKIYLGFLKSIKETVESYDFEVYHHHYQSKKSYSYYFEFKDDDDNRYRFKFRVADHPSKKEDEDFASIKPNKSGWIDVFRAIVVGDKHEFKSPTEAIFAVSQMCKSLKQGDIDIVLRRYGFTTTD